MFQHIRKMSGTSASLLLLLLLSADIGFIVLHIIIGIFDPNPALCNISGICAYMNVYHLIKMFWIIILFFSILKSTKYAGYSSWILMFTCFFIDDAFWLHQNIGDRIAAILNYPGLPSRLYELAVLAIAGLVLAGFVSLSYFHGSYTFRKISINVFLFLAALVFFGLIVDIAQVLGLGNIVITALGFVEDAGELIVYSLIVWYVFLLAICKGKSEVFLLELRRKL